MTSTRDREINIDQNSAAAEEWGVNMDSFAPLGQSFTAVSDHVRFIGMWFSTSPNIPPVRFQLTLLEGAGFSGATVDARYATAPAGLYGFLYFDFSGTKLTVGSKYTALIVQDPRLTRRTAASCWDWRDLPTFTQAEPHSFLGRLLLIPPRIVTSVCCTQSTRRRYSRL
jgi:hypothetical protein